MKDSDQRTIIVLGIDPLSLRYTSAENECSREASADSALIRRFDLHFGRYFDPIDIVQNLQEMTATWRGRQPYSTFYSEQWDYDNGWCGVRCNDPDRLERNLQYWRQRRDIPWKISEEMIDLLEKQVKEWVSRGILVVGFRPPTHPEMKRLEDSGMQYDGPSVIQRFKEAGGIWLELNAREYQTYDSSHWDMENAHKVSQTIARRILEHIQADHVGEEAEPHPHNE